MDLEGQRVVSRRAGCTGKAESGKKIELNDS